MKMRCMRVRIERNENMRRPELLIPASSLEVLKIAVIYGADAVYIGGEAFGLRAKAKNFSMEEIREGIAFAHAHDVKVYITANILAHNGDLDGVREYFAELREIKPDALIISDPGVYMIAKEVCPEIERHISTQANNTNYGTYRFWYEQGAKRVVSARELRWLRSRKSVPIFRTILRSRRSFTEQCASPTREGAYCPITLPDEMPTRERAHIRAAGNTRLWRKNARENTCRSMRMSAVLIFSIPRIFA